MLDEVSRFAPFLNFSSALLQKYGTVSTSSMHSTNCDFSTLLISMIIKVVTMKFLARVTEW